VPLTNRSVDRQLDIDRTLAIKDVKRLVNVTYYVVTSQQLVLHFVTPWKHQESCSATNRGQAKSEYDGPLQFNLRGNKARGDDTDESECGEWDVEKNCVKLIETETL
jgi:hypothetical protein